MTAMPVRWSRWWLLLIWAATHALGQPGGGGSARQQLDQAQQLERDGKLAAALASISAAYRQAPVEFTAGDWRLSARVCSSLRYLDDALRCARQAYELQADIDGLCQLVDVLVRREDFGEARLCLRQATQRHRLDREPGWPYDRMVDLAGQVYRAANENPAVRKPADAELYLQLANERQRSQNQIEATLALIRAFNEVGRYDEARKWLGLWVKAGRPGNAGTKQAYEQQLDEAGIQYEYFSYTLRPDDPRSEVREWHQAAGGWDVLLPGPTGYRQSAAVLTNTRSWVEHLDRAENRHLVVVPEDPAKPVEVRIVSKYTGNVLDLEGELSAGYDVPERYRRYLGVSPDGHIDPTTPLARSLAESLKGATVAETIRRTYWWWTTNVEYGAAETTEDWGWVSEHTLRHREGVCHDMSSAATALLRANGIACRLVRGPGHTWPEVWFPRSGWMPFQSLLRHNTFRPIGGALFDGEVVPREYEGASRVTLCHETSFAVEWLWQTKWPDSFHRLALLTDDVPLEQVVREAKLPGTLVP